MKRTITLLLIAAAFAALWSVRSLGQDRAPASTPQTAARFVTSTPVIPTPIPSTPVVHGPYEYPDGMNPMTGLPYPDAEARARRNLIVKISNHPPIVRPQHGLNAADLVFEYEAEGNVTRFAAVFRANNPGRVGSIRSGRPAGYRAADDVFGAAGVFPARASRSATFISIPIIAGG